jgi:arylformamidase
MIHDLSRPISPALAVFPGDAPVRLTAMLSMARGDACNASALAMSAHAGTHADAPRHCIDGAPGVDALDLDALVGPARVVSVAGRGPIGLPELRALPLEGASRLLFHTPASDAPGDAPGDAWDPRFAHFTPQAAAWLAGRGARLVGIDTPSVDPADSTDLPAHQALLGRGVIVLENLLLSGVPDGDYELIALPIRIAGGDGAPARVILRAPAAAL